MNETPNPLHPTHLPSAPGWPLHPAMVTSDLVLPGFQIARSHGIVRGFSVGMFSGSGVGGALASIGQALGNAQGSVQKVVEVTERAHGEALFIMLQRAAQLGANAIIGFRYNITGPPGAFVIVIAYGTAVFAELRESRSDDKTSS